MNIDIREINVLVLEYLGDAVYEVFIRDYLIKKKISNVNDLQKESLYYVSAKSQANILKELIDNNFLTTEELDIVKRGRNCKNSRHPKNCDALTYKHATAFETLIGYLYFDNKKERLNEIIDYILKGENIKC